MVAPVANPPAPDVEARPDMLLAYRLGHLAVWIGPSRWSDAGGKKWQADAVLREAISELAALTAHTASLQARVKELERAKADTVEIADQALAIAQAERDEAVKDGAWEKRRADDLEAEANRMREALEPFAERASQYDDRRGDYTVAILVEMLRTARAALRPADEPVTQREM